MPPAQRCSLLLLLVRLLTAADPIVLAAPTAWKDTRHHPLGIQAPTLVVDAERDAAALRALGVRYLRGGDQRHTIWSEPPYARPNRVTAVRGARAWPANDRSLVEADGVHLRPGVAGPDFAGILDLAAGIGAEPLVILTYNTLHLPPTAGIEPPDRATLLAAAEAQVRWAARERPQGVTYWELGNEVWNKAESGDVQLRADQVRDDLREFVPRLRAADPRVRILVSGNGEAWFSTLLEADEHIDYLNFSWYLWDFREGFADVRRRPRLLDDAQSFRGAMRAIDALPAPRRDRLGIVITEFNALDWQGKPHGASGWDNRNDHGHALAVVQMAGEALAHPRVHLANVWTSRYAWPLDARAADDGSVYNALRNDGTPTAIGMAVALWGNALAAELATLGASDPALRAWASRDAAGSTLTLVLLNTDPVARRWSAPWAEGWRATARRALVGDGLDDPRPRWVELVGDELPANSAAVISCARVADAGR